MTEKAAGERKWPIGPWDIEAQRKAAEERTREKAAEVRAGLRGSPDSRASEIAKLAPVVTKEADDNAAHIKGSKSSPSGLSDDLVRELAYLKQSRQSPTHLTALHLPIEQYVWLKRQSNATNVPMTKLISRAIELLRNSLAI